MSALAPDAPAFLNRMASSLSDLLQSGLTAASGGTLDRLRSGFQEASRLKLLRLGATLRQLVEEVDRFALDSDEFSAKRFMFFVNRAWLLCTAMERAHAAGDADALNALLMTPDVKRVKQLTLVAMGVQKRHVPGRFCSFEFRLRALDDEGVPGDLLTWSCVFPLRKGLDVPPEAFLDLDQPQGFRPSVFLQGTPVLCNDVALGKGARGGLRLQLAGSSTVEPVPSSVAEGGADGPMPRLDYAGAAQRIGDSSPDPLELEIERVEESVFDFFEPLEDPPQPDKESAGSEPRWWTWSLGALEADLRIEPGPGGDEMIKRLVALLDKGLATHLYGTLHYESLRIAFQPLTALTPKGVNHLTLSEAKISKAELIQAMNFR